MIETFLWIVTSCQIETLRLISDRTLMIETHALIVTLMGIETANRDTSNIKAD